MRPADENETAVLDRRTPALAWIAPRAAALICRAGSRRLRPLRCLMRTRGC